MPITPITDGVLAYALAFAEQVAESHDPSCAVESSQAWNCRVLSPAFQWFCSSTSWIAWFICTVWC